MERKWEHSFVSQILTCREIQALTHLRAFKNIPDLQRSVVSSRSYQNVLQIWFTEQQTTFLKTVIYVSIVNVSFGNLHLVACCELQELLPTCMLRVICQSHLDEICGQFSSILVMNSDGVLRCQALIHVCVTINKVIRIP